MLRNSLENPANLHDFLESALPEEVANLDFSSVRPLSREFLTADWHEREADLVFEIPCKVTGQVVPALVGVMIEHQSDTDTVVPLRALFNLTGFWERHWRQWATQPRPRGPLLLPPVFSVVLYTGEVAWGSNANIREMLAPPATFHPFAPDWGPVFWNLAERTPEQLLAGGPWMQFLAVMRMTAGERAAFEDVYMAAVGHLGVVQDMDPVRWSELLRMILSYAQFRRPNGEWDRLRAIAEIGTPTRVEEIRSMWKTIAEAQMEEGRLQQARQLLRELIEDRFGPLPEPLLQQIEAQNDLARLSAAARKVYRVNSQDEITI
jgi:hypothetical protein